MREREAETQAEGEAGSMHREPDVGFDPGSPGSRPGPKAGAKPLRHPGIPMEGHLSRKSTRNLDILEQMDLTDIFRTFYPKVTGYTFFSSTRKTFSRMRPGNLYLKSPGDPWVAQQFSACLWPRARSWRPRIESHVGLPVHGACFSLCLCLCLSLSLCVTVINK